MEYSATALWQKSLEKAQINNRQLDFWRNINIGYVSSSDRTPQCDIIKYRKTVEDGKCQMFLVSVLDARTQLYKDLLGNDTVSLCWYFPLSKEKYRLKARLMRITKTSYSKEATVQEGQVEKTLSGQSFQKIWESELSKDERKVFTELQPDTKTEEKTGKSHDDINDYNTPEVAKVSENFAVLMFEIDEVEHIRFTMPQVIADSRTTSFESLFAPYKVTTKHLHTRSKQDPTKWDATSLNP